MTTLIQEAVTFGSAGDFNFSASLNDYPVSLFHVKHRGRAHHMLACPLRRVVAVRRGWSSSSCREQRRRAPPLLQRAVRLAPT